jgi:Flp pilus assembly protein TadG
VLVFRRRRNERGVAAVELALVLPVLLIVVFGIIDFGITFGNYETVRSGTREAARLGVVNDLQNAPSCKVNGQTVTPPSNPQNTTDGTNALICLAKDRIGLDQTETKIKITITGQAIGDNVDVCASFPVTALNGFTAPFLSGQILTSSVTMRLEQVPQFTGVTETGVAC